MIRGYLVHQVFFSQVFTAAGNAQVPLVTHLCTRLAARIELETFDLKTVVLMAIYSHQPLTINHFNILVMREYLHSSVSLIPIKDSNKPLILSVARVAVSSTYNHTHRACKYTKT